VCDSLDQPGCAPIFDSPKPDPDFRPSAKATAASAFFISLAALAVFPRKARLCFAKNKITSIIL